MTEKRFQIDDDGDITEFENQQWIDTFEYGNGKDWNNICKRLNELFDENEQLKKDATTLIYANQDYRKENEQLKQQLKDYHNAFDCSQCRYQNYDWFDDGDEFEVCDKGNNEAQMDNHSCKDWEEL